ncbi:MAG: 30S ribosomal protein S6 [Opitutales bacterium]
MSEIATERRHLYRANFILDTRNHQDSVESLIARLSDVIAGLGGEVKKVDDLGQKDFLRVTNRHFPAGIYVQYTFEGPATAPSALQEKLRLDRTVNRVMVQRMDG